MRDKRTGRLFFLVHLLQERHGPYPLGRPAFVTWLNDQLDQLPGDDGMAKLIDDYPAHLDALEVST